MDTSKNEIFIAIFLGILVGLISVVSFYYIFKQKRLFVVPEDKISVNLQKQTAADKKAVSQAFDLSVEPAEAEVVSQAPEFKINGHTLKDASIIIQSDNLSKIVTPDADGNFSYTLDLNSDVNQVFISALYNGQEKTVEKTIYYEKKLP